MVINILQLAYLGVMFDSDPSQTEVFELFIEIIQTKIELSSSRGFMVIFETFVMNST